MGRVPDRHAGNPSSPSLASLKAMRSRKTASAGSHFLNRTMACRTKASRQRVRVLERWKARGLPSGTCVHSNPLTLTVNRSLALRRSLAVHRPLMGDRRHIKAWRPNGTRT